MSQSRGYDDSLPEIFPHAKFDRAYRAMLVYFLRIPRGRVILLTGPTGSGKSLITRMLLNKHPPVYFGNVGMRLQPVVLLKARNFMDKGYFSIRDLWLEGLSHIEHPLVSSPLIHKRLPTTARLATAFGRALRAIGTRFLIIDEAQHIREVQGGDRNAQKLLDTLKVFAEDFEVVLVLSGAYPLLQTVELGPQLSRRTHRLPMFRYFSHRPGDLAEFQKIVQFFCNKKKLSYTELIEPLMGELYEASLGICGIVEKILFEVSLGLEVQERNNPSTDDVRQIIRKAAVSRSIQQETFDGEEFLRSNDPSSDQSQKKSRRRGTVVKKPSKKKKPPRKGRDFGRDPD
jgi:energy-coupling factor transporter ATP-binding protein EcfA2